MTPYPERNESLWTLTVSPAIWAAHLLLSYVTAAVFCAKLAGPDGGLGAVRAAIAAYTALALLGIGLTGARAFRRHRAGDGEPRHGLDEAESRHQFLGFATVLLSGLSAIATLYAALVAVFVERCR